MAILLQNSVNNHVSIPLFVIFSCALREDGSLLQPEYIQCRCAKLIYLMKLTVLHLVENEHSDNKEGAMKSLLLLICTENFNIFTVLCQLKDQATRICQ